MCDIGNGCYQESGVASEGFTRFQVDSQVEFSVAVLDEMDSSIDVMRWFGGMVSSSGIHPAQSGADVPVPV